MQGGVRKRGTTWSYYFDLGKIDGKRKKKEKGGFKTKKEAEQALTAAMNEYNNAGTVFEPTEITVADYLNQWFDLYCKTNLKYNTQVGYLRIIQGHLIPKSTIHEDMNEDSNPKIKTLEQLAYGLNCRITDLFESNVK